MIAIAGLLSFQANVRRGYHGGGVARGLLQPNPPRNRGESATLWQGAARAAGKRLFLPESLTRMSAAALWPRRPLPAPLSSPPLPCPAWIDCVTLTSAPFILGGSAARTSARWRWAQQAATPRCLKTLTERPRSSPATISDRDSLNSRRTLVPAASETQCLEILSVSVLITAQMSLSLPSLFCPSNLQTIRLFDLPYYILSVSLIAQLVNNPPAMQENPVRVLGRKDPLEKGKATHFSILGLPLWLSWWRIRLQCGRRGFDPPRFDPWVGKIPWRREQLPTPGFWPGEFHGLYSPWGLKKVGHDWSTFT